MTISQAADEVLVSQEGGVVRVTLNRPKQRHALSESLIAQLDETLIQIGNDSTALVVVLGASGPVFSSGHDLKEMTGRSEAEYQMLFANCSRMMMRIQQIPQPVIGRIQGFATAAGCQLVGACDLAVACESAQFATPGVKIGLFCSTPMVPLVRNVAPKFAMEMLLTGKPISAEQAMTAGLINRVAADEQQMDAVIDEWCEAILATSPLTIRLGKKAFYEQRFQPESKAYEQVVEVMTKNAIAGDAQEGISAFLEKRPPQWTGE